MIADVGTMSHFSDLATNPAFFSIAAIASVSGCGHSPAVVPVEPTNAEYQVLSSYLSGKLKADAEHSTLNLVIINETLGARDDPRTTDEMYKLIPTLRTTHREVFRTFLETNHHSSNFQSLFVIPVPYQIVKSSEIQSTLGAANFWGRFYREYPHSSGLLELSRVGFNRDGTQAALYTSTRCRVRCGSGYFVIMQKDSNSEWKIVREVQLWVL